MSTDDRHGFGQRLSNGAVLEHPLIGLERRRTAVAVAFLAVLIGLFGVSYVGTTVTIGGTTLDALTPRFDTVSTVLIALATVTVTVLPFVYAAWNGGPGVAVALALVPVALGDLAAGRYVLGTDTAIALTVAGAASALAVVATDIRETNSLRPWRAAECDTGRLLFATVTAVVAAVGVTRFVAVAPPRSLEWYAPFAVLWFVPVGVLTAYWGSLIRTTVATQAERETAEP